MSYPRYVLERLVFAVVSVYAVVTVTFFAATATVWFRLEERLAAARYAGATPEEIARIRENFVVSRGLDVPLHERYLGWLVDVTTLQWGDSVVYGEPVIAVLDGRVSTTLGYVLPGVAVAVVLGVGLGVTTALERDGPADWLSRLVAYVLLGVPAFMLITYAEFVGGRAVGRGLSGWLVATLTVAAATLAGQLRFARTAALEQTGRAFVRTLHAKGTTRLVLARHVLKNASLQVVSLSVSELLSVLALTVYVVETVLPVDGLAAASLRAVYESDVALVIWSTMVIVLVGVVGNFCKDVLYGYLDPRVHAE